MVLLKIFKLDDENPIAALNDGQHELGRGSLLECTDQRVSRKQAVLDVTQEEVTITSIHVRPCFFISANSSTVTILPKNKPVKLKNGDKFGLMPDQYWYKFLMEKDQVQQKSEVRLQNNIKLANGDESLSRSAKIIPETHFPVFNHTSALPPWLTNTPEKNNELESSNKPTTSNCKRKIEPDQETSPKISKLSENCNVLENILKRENENGITEETNTLNDEVQISEIKAEDLPIIKQELSESDDDTVNNSDEKVKIKQECDETASGSNANQEETKLKVKRDRCWYGESCYRKNPLHRKEYSHPNDSDYESDPDDNRPLCPYGTNCYRRNADHRKEYRHTDTNAASPKPNTKKPTPKKKNQKPDDTSATKRQRKTYYESPEDDYDLEDPFIDDGSEDEYVAENDSNSDYSDSEVNDSENLEEDDTKRLLKEAKRFTRRGK